MRTTTGTLLMLTGGLHQAVGLMLYREPLLEILRAGVLGTVDDMSPRASAFWFLVVGWGLMLLGGLARWAERATGRPLPSGFGWALVALGVFCVVPMPETGAWVFFPLGALALYRGRPAPEQAPLGIPRVFVEGADHIDVKTVESEASLREFVAGLMSYQPVWLTALFVVRAVFVRFLGLRQERLPRLAPLRAETVPMTPGAKASFFTVRHAEEERTWVAGAADSHLDAILAVTMESAPERPRRFHVVTLVHYRNWAGPVYFNVIRPFHHLVVGAMARAAATPQ
ncbi:hypothetical protein MYSTI_01210 [Myxococcus stipitatus DSM 14675]|uniref:DUF2867 domain-containing protein n=1 Tax=Myxococcus stipitatus (strain DSM 14675 / JCM 12634 / Mx s8) TaxID=1278073 RepID=L7U2Y2_MYXSD|nr:DUF6463 family protein [Myxococcus stipitatus]AGC42558.1 hypothetical protein MYSTI_01210 [Myxococcus stipitatus DSM 14675]